MNVEIIKASANDFEELSKLYQEIHDYHLEFDEIYSSSEKYKREVKEIVQKDLENLEQLNLIAKVDGKYAGFAVFKIITKSQTEPERIGFLRKAYVRPEFRGAGVFKKLYAEGEEWVKAQGVDYLELSCDTNNDLGLKTWDALGFKEVKKTMRKKI